MSALRWIVLSTIVLLVVGTLPASPVRAEDSLASPTTLFGLVGQVTNSAPGITPATSIQYGYLTQVRGIDGSFALGGHDESNALFTFFTSATTTRVVTNGNFRTVTRMGVTTLYLNSTPTGNFAVPDSFRAGVPIQTSIMKQQVVITISTGAFRTVNVNAITSTTAFSQGGRSLRIGAVGSAYTTFLIGQLHSPSPPSGYFSGYALEGRGTFTDTSSSGVSAVPVHSSPGGFGISASIVVSFPSVSAGNGMVLFGSGPGCGGLVEVATRDLFSHTVTHAVVVTGNDLPGSVGDNGIQPGATYWYEVVSIGPGGPRIDDNHGSCYQVTVPAS
ncbi:MAG: hypothetical protein PVSMB7_18430 [Chloroflexota bacterium]